MFIFNIYISISFVSELKLLDYKCFSRKKMNASLLATLAGEKKRYKSVDIINYHDRVIYYSTEFLNNLEPTGTSPQNLFAIAQDLP